MRGVIDELDTSCDGSASKGSLAKQMLSNASIPEEERATETLCLQFVRDYFDAKNWIDDERLEAATALNGERIASGFETVGEKLGQLRHDTSLRDNNTELILDQIIGGNLTYEQAREHVRRHGDSTTSPCSAWPSSPTTLALSTSPHGTSLRARSRTAKLPSCTTGRPSFWSPS